MDPRDFHKLAERLAAGSTPAEYRTAIGRAYYAAFNVGAESLRGMGFRVGKGAAAHGEVQHSLQNGGVPSIAAVASELKMLHTMRNRADYQLDAIDVEKQPNAIRIVVTTRDLINSLDAALRGPQRAQIQSAIGKWRRENGYP
jgi:hypothetical protein